MLNIKAKKQSATSVKVINALPFIFKNLRPKSQKEPYFWGP